MESVYFVLAGVVLYVVADWIVQRAEVAHGRRFEYRTLYFFVILLGLAVLSFNLIQRMVY